MRCLLLLALFLPACSGDDDDASAEPSDVPGDAPPTPAQDCEGEPVPLDVILYTVGL